MIHTVTKLSAGDFPLNTLIHPTAVIHPSAKLAPKVKVGPYAVIGANVEIEADTIIDAHVVIEGPTKIGKGNHIFSGAVIGNEPQDLKYKGGESTVEIGDYNQIREFVTINRATDTGEVTQIGSNNLLMAYVHVAHNCILQDNIIIANSVALAGHVQIESKAVIGGVLGVHQFVHIGKMAMLGGMSRIDRDVPPFTLVEGNPCRVRTLNLVGLQRAGFTDEDLALLKKAFRIIYRSNINLQEALEQVSLLTDNPHVQHLCQFLQSSTTGEKRRGLIPGK